MGVEGQPHAPVSSTPRKDPVPIVQEAGWAPGLVWTGGNLRIKRRAASRICRFTLGEIASLFMQEEARWAPESI